MSTIKKKLSQDKVKDVLIQLDGDKKCHEGKVEINGLQMRDGIGSVELTLEASEQPEVTIIYSPYLITKETAEVLGLRKMNYKRTSS